jgi:glucose/arabinose dehydrogenase
VPALKGRRTRAIMPVMGGVTGVRWVSALFLAACGGGGSSATAPATADTTTTTGSTTATTSTGSPANPDTSTGDPSGSSTTTAPGTSSTSDDGGETEGPPIDCGAASRGSPGPTTLELVAQGLPPTVVTASEDPSHPGRYFAASIGGDVSWIEPPSTAQTLVTLPVVAGAELGLLGLALHPGYPADPRIYVAYTIEFDGPLVFPLFDGHYLVRIEELTLAQTDPPQLDPGPRRIILDVFHTNSFHKGGMIAFAPDGLLWISSGEGDNLGTLASQRDPAHLLGKMLRIGVEADGEPDLSSSCGDCPILGPFDYTIPADNPFADDPSFAPEVYAMGFRNPWRFSIDACGGDVYVGDVGGESWEEVNRIAPAGDFGWPDEEGFCGGCDEVPPGGVSRAGITQPLTAYAHSQGRCSVTGGAVIRMPDAPDYNGVLVFADYCTGEVFGLRRDGDMVEELGVIAQAPSGAAFTGSGSAADGGALFTGSLFGIEGAIWRVTSGA